MDVELKQLNSLYSFFFFSSIKSSSIELTHHSRRHLRFWPIPLLPINFAYYYYPLGFTNNDLVTIASLWPLSSVYRHHGRKYHAWDSRERRDSCTSDEGVSHWNWETEIMEGKLMGSSYASWVTVSSLMTTHDRHSCLKNNCSCSGSSFLPFLLFTQNLSTVCHHLYSFCVFLPLTPDTNLGWSALLFTSHPSLEVRWRCRERM